jgi:methylmalonyl-CoA/ethylmalonyl-CoA epimerase
MSRGSLPVSPPREGAPDVRRLTEIGIAVEDLERAGRGYRDLLGAEESATFDVGAFRMAMRMFRVGNIDFELMAPAGDGGLIARFLMEKGEGIHHIAFEVADIRDTVGRMKRLGVEMAVETPFEIEGLKAVFLHPRATAGVLIEFIEGSPRWVAGQVLPESLREPYPGRGVAALGLAELTVGVRDLDSAASTWSAVFSSAGGYVSAGSGGRSHRSWIMRTGNVNLKLMELSEEDRPAAHRGGIDHVTLKVADLVKAAAFLEAARVEFSVAGGDRAGCPAEIAVSGAAFGGAAIHLIEAAP